MPAMSTFTKGALIAHLLRTGSFTKPSAVWIGLYTAADVELSGAGYGRVQAGPSDAYWSDQANGDGRSSNLVAVVFGSPGANWGIAAKVKLLDAETGGNILMAGTLATPKTINSGDDPPEFPIGSLVLTFA